MSVQVEGYRNESFESLEAAVMETPRGRWFLEEYARRQRSAETLAILDILKKLENSIADNGFSTAPKMVETAKPINPEQLKFFKQDEEIFVEPAVTAPNLTIVNSTPQAEVKQPTESKGAKLKIQRSQSPEMPTEPVAAAPQPEIQETTVQETAASPAPQPVNEPKQRVVIIRRPASEAAEIPLMEDNKSEAAA